MSAEMIKLGRLIVDGFQNGIYKPSELYGEGAPIVRINDYDNDGSLNDGDLLRVKLDNSEIERFRLEPKDILVNRVNSLTHLGKSCLINTLDEATVYESNMMRLRIGDDSAVIPEYIACILQTSKARNYFRRVAKPAVAQASINQDDVKSLQIPVYDKLTQLEIVNTITTWSGGIQKVEKLIASKNRRYQYLLSHLVNDVAYCRGHVRDFTSEVSIRNRSNESERVLSVTNTNGFVLPEDQFERRVASANLSNYKIVEHGQYAYNPSRINVGSIARLDDWDEGVLSPMYVVFKLNDEKVNSDFFLHWLSSYEARQRIKRSAQGSVRETVSFADLGSIPFPLPDKDRQASVAEVLNAAKREMDLLKQLAKAYREQKRGLMQRLQSGEWCVKVGKEVA
ncbi:MAG: hypothetical protein AB2652_15700 [Candidatus Thiodiazotropha endolucinida]